MLSFLREQKSEDTSGQITASGEVCDVVGDKSEDVNNSSLAASQDEQVPKQGYLTVKSRDRQVIKGTIVLGVLFCIGLICLITMIKSSAPQTASAAGGGQVNVEEARIEAAIMKFINVKSEMFGRTDEMIKKLYKISDIQQVKVDELVKNPFLTEGFWGGKEKALIVEEDVFDSAQTLELVSIMRLNNANCCMINDKLLYKGDSIEGYSVRQINNNSVKLSNGDKETVLNLAE